MVDAASASPSARMTDAWRSCSAFSTMNLARSASCCAICFCSTADVNSLPNLAVSKDQSARSLGERTSCGSVVVSSEHESHASCTHNRDILELDVELLGTLQQVVADTRRDDLTVGDELGSVKLRDGGLEHLVTDGRKDTLVVARKVSTSRLTVHCSNTFQTHSRPRFW